MKLSSLIDIKDVASKIQMRDSRCMETKIKDPRNLTEYARTHLIEQIMALGGRSCLKPLEYREQLHNMPLEKLRLELAAVARDEWSTAA